MIEHLSKVLVCFCCVSTLYGQSSGFLPIYDDPMVFLDSTGRVVGQLPKGYSILNTPEGKHYGGWAKGMAVNSAAEEGLIPAIYYDASDISLFDFTGKRVKQFGGKYHSITPNYGGFHLAARNSGQFATPVYFFLNRDGEQVFAADGYAAATPFHEGIAAVRWNADWTYLDTLGREYHVIDTSMKRIRSVSPFYEGMSKIKFGPGKKCKFSTCHDYVFIDQAGNIVLDTRVLFPDVLIRNVGDMHDGYALVELHSDSLYENGPVVYLHRSGRMIRIENVYRRNPFNHGLALVVTEKRNPDGRGMRPDSVFLIDTLGRRLLFPTVDGYIPYEAFRVDDHIYYVTCWNDRAGVVRLYDSRLRKYIYEAPDRVMGVKWSLVSLYDGESKRYYVVDYKTGEVVYDTDVGDMVWTDIAGAVAKADQVRIFVCKNVPDLARLNELKALTDLTIEGMDAESLPALELPHLKKLKIDNLMKLKMFPSQIKNLEKIALRDCVSATNLMELLEGQTQLRELYVINFGLTPEQEEAIRNMFPQTRVVIEGTLKMASSALQMYIDGF